MHKENQESQEARKVLDHVLGLPVRVLVALLTGRPDPPLPARRTWATAWGVVPTSAASVGSGSTVQTAPAASRDLGRDERLLRSCTALCVCMAFLYSIYSITSVQNNS